MVTGHSPGADSERGPGLAQKLGRQCMQKCLHRIAQFGGDHHWCNIECFYYRYEKSTMTMTSKELTALSKQAQKKQLEEYGDWAKAVFAALAEAIALEVLEGFVFAGAERCLRSLPRQLCERQPPGPGSPTNVADRGQLCEATSIVL